MVFLRPTNEEELQQREAIGVIRASRFVRRYAQSHEPISVAVIKQIHAEIFNGAWPEIAGVWRLEELSIADSDLLLPHYSQVPVLMDKLNELLSEKLVTLGTCGGQVFNLSHEITDDVILCIENIIDITTWLHHAITAIHPFREGNGRTARLAANLILERFGLVGISVKIEKENKNAYRNALAQIDKHGDYEPLKTIIMEGIIERYNGVSMRYYPTS